MSATADLSQAQETPEQRFISEIKAITTLENLLGVGSYENICRLGPSIEVIDAMTDHMQMLMRQRIATIKTPEDVIEVHNYFKSHKVYSRVIQVELGVKAKSIIEAWHPNTRAFHSVSHRN